MVFHTSFNIYNHLSGRAGENIGCPTVEAYTSESSLSYLIDKVADIIRSSLMGGREFCYALTHTHQKKIGIYLSVLSETKIKIM